MTVTKIECKGVECGSTGVWVRYEIHGVDGVDWCFVLCDKMPALANEPEYLPVEVSLYKYGIDETVFQKRYPNDISEDLRERVLDAITSWEMEKSK